MKIEGFVRILKTSEYNLRLGLTTFRLSSSYSHVPLFLWTAPALSLGHLSEDFLRFRYKTAY